MKKVRIPYIVQWNFRVSFKNGIPWIRRQKVDLQEKKFVLVNEISKIPLEMRKEYVLLFYAEESQFNAFYTNLNELRLDKLRGFYAICGLDYSTYPDGDDDENRVAIKRNRGFCVYCQQMDMLCIYNVVWTGKQDYSLAFDNVEKGAVVVVSTYRIQDPDDAIFGEGYEWMKKKIEPSLILCYGKIQKCMEQDLKLGLVRRIPTRREIVKQEQFERSGQCSFLDMLKSA